MDLFEIPLEDQLPQSTELPETSVRLSVAQNKSREMKKCGICEGYFEKIDVAIVKLTSPLREGDQIIFEKPSGLFEQEVNSMQINRKDVRLARTGSDIGLKVSHEPTVGGTVYKVIH